MEIFKWRAEGPESRQQSRTRVQELHKRRCHGPTYIEEKRNEDSSRAVYEQCMKRFQPWICELLSS